MKDSNQVVKDRIINYIVENQQKFYRIAYCYVNQREAALDIVQNAICNGLEKCDQLRNPNAIKTWFYRILINECLQYLNKYKREILYEPSEFKEEVYYEDAYEDKLEVFQKVCDLPEHLKTVILLHYFEDLTLKEISKSTGINLSTVKTRLYAGLKKIRYEMEKEYEGIKGSKRNL